jgi:hypothetical protein
MMKKTGFQCVLVLLPCMLATWLFAAEMSQPDPELRRTIYSEEETLRFSVSWLGIKGGELVMQLRRDPESEDSFLLEVTAKTAGLLELFYPVTDHFQTVVRGEHRLPVRYTLEQNEGKRHNLKVTNYDQQAGEVRYKRNEEPEEIYRLDGPVHNEFSSFMYTRILSFAGPSQVIVPTFADRKRHEIVVTLEAQETLESIFGRRSTIRVVPHLTFQGLYEKVGDPNIWFTDDEHRGPLKIKARIAIGSLTAELVEYHGPLGSAALEEERPR